MILTLKTNEPQAEIGFYSTSGERITYEIWQAHRELSSTILVKLTEMLKSAGMAMDDIKSVVFYEGPGSFTGLRIGAAMVNALEVPVACANGENWIENGIKALKSGQHGSAIPFYGREPHITEAKK